MCNLTREKDIKKVVTKYAIVAFSEGNNSLGTCIDELKPLLGMDTSIKWERV